MLLEERLRNEEAKIILTQEPSRFTRWGITIIFFVLCALFIISSLIKYSDTIKVEIVLVKENKPVKIISGSIDSIIIGKINIPVIGAGKIQQGQKVNIKLDNYPYEEYGILYGEIISTSLIPNDKRYAIEVKLTNGLTTSYKKQIPFSQRLHGQADIITKKLSVAQRIFYQMTSIFKNR